mmetsp:Transcript_98322/g.316978  ORF Transcript_98322/g.316978 Transcript_98322/m.316978 type:complete len:332 (+) Transcript_98322:2-997(+)
MDPLVRRDDYLHPANEGQHGATWDIKGLEEDLRLTQETYCMESLDAALQPIREEMKRLAPTRPRRSGAVEVLPGVLMLGDADSARDLEALQRLRVQRIVNCSPQTVKTGSGFYQTALPGAKYMELWEDDLLDYCVLDDLEVVWSFATAGGCCLIHCEQGVNRSGALVVAIHMRLRVQRGDVDATPEEALRNSWSLVADRKARVLTNPSFQRQLLLYARMGLRWFPSVSDVWRTPRERNMAKFRLLAERVARDVVRSCEMMPQGRQHRSIVYIRDGTMRGEMRMQEAFDLGSPEAQRRAEHRIRSYAHRSLPKLSREDSPPPEPLPVPAAAV